MGRKLIMLLTLVLLVAAYAQGDVQNMSPYIDTGYISRGFGGRAVGDTISADCYSDTIAVIGAQEVVGEVMSLVIAQGGTLFVQLQGSNDLVYFTNLAADNESLAVSAVGNYGLVFDHATVYRYYRMYFNEVENGSSWIYNFRVGGHVNYGG